MGFILGIDGGGTKTECVLADEAGAVLARATGGGANVRRASAAELRATLSGCFTRLREAASLRKLSAEVVRAGFAGAADSGAREKARGVLAELLHPAHLYVVGDMEVALEAAVGAGAGVVLVAGTGSIAFGRNQQGQTARAGGGGPEAGSDEGSGYDIGRRAVAALKLGTRLEESTPSEIAGLVPAVASAARSGDQPARKILEEAGKALAGLALSVLRELGLLQAEVTVATTGGVFLESPEVLALAQAAIRCAAPRAQVEPLRVSPAEGAVQLGLRLRLDESGKAKV